MPEPDATVAPGGTIGILGGGQLGRMLALAAARLGYRCHVFSPEPDSPAALVAAEVTVAAYDDDTALDRFAAAIDVATYEFENIPGPTVERIAAHVSVRPSLQALKTTQDRLYEKDFVHRMKARTAAYEAVATPDELRQALSRLGLPAVLKTRRLGYDGKGQALIHSAAEADGAWDGIAGAPAILEAFVDFEQEVSVVAARGLDGAVESYVPVENRHVNHILDTTLAPAPIPAALAAEAQAVAGRLLAGLDYVGVLAVELFVTREGGLLVNELAPRVHNSGHWTIEACRTSQFEQHVRAICGLPLGAPDRLMDAEMKNLIGEEALRWRDILAEPGAHLHLYGKAEVRPGRKMGHVTRLRPKRGA